MGIQQKDPEYLRAKYAFIRDLIQFHESRGTGLQCDPKINGKEIDLYLLYQIVTSHGGWEKINLRNEWDKLLEHFHMPRSTNGGVAIKQIYLKYLELYEKIHYLGEDIDTKEEQDDEYEDFRGRRRYPNKLSSSHHHHSSTSSHGHHHHHHAPPKEVTDHNRSQLGLSSRILETSDYEGLLLSLQSPLANEQDMAISVCTLLSNETKHVLRFSKSPAILNMLLAHAGIYQDCGMRNLMEETYRDARNMDYAEFWDEVLQHPDARQLLCECFVKRVHASLGLTDDEGAILSQIQEIEDGDLPEEEKFSLGTSLRLKLERIRESRRVPSLNSSENEGPKPCTKPDDEVSGNGNHEDTNANPPDEKMEQDLEEEEKIEVDTPTPEEKVEKIEVDTPTTAEEKIEEETPTTEEEKVEKIEVDPPTTEEEKAEKIEIDTPTPEELSVELADGCKQGPPENVNGVAVEGKEVDCIELNSISQEDAKYEQVTICCSSCPCQRTDTATGDCSVEFSIERPSSKRGQVMVDEAGDGPANSLPFTLTRTHGTGDKVGQRICQIAHILRNLSFEQDNACIMAKSPTLMRFLLVTANCTFGTLPQTSFDIIGNLSSYIRLEEPLKDPLSSMLLTLITSGVFSTDRFKILRSMEALRELTKVEGNENVIARYVENRVYRRMCDLLTLSDIMLLIYTLECILSMTGLGEAVCDEIVRVQGSVATLVSLVTVEAQSYGPKGCILMRVVETVTGSNTVTPQPTSTSLGQPSSSSTAQQTQLPVASPSTNQSVSSQPQHLLQQQLLQPPISTPVHIPTTPSRIPAIAQPPPSTSPGLKYVTGTTTVVPPVQGQNHLSQQIKPIANLSPAGIPPQFSNPSTANSSQVFTTNPSSTLLNHLSSPTPPVTHGQIVQQQQQQFLPSHPHSMPVGQATGVAGTLQGNIGAVLQTPSALPAIPSDPHHPQQQQLQQHHHIQIANNNSNGNIVGGAAQPTTLVVHNNQTGNSCTPSTAAAVVIPAAQPIVAVNGAATVGGAAANASLATGSLPQIANQNLNQHVVTPSISLVTARGTLSEEAWAIAWLKGTFESSSGTSIEQGEIYRMYSAARKNPNLVLSLEQFVQCVKCAYGASVGPVIKQFGGGTSLPFFEGIKPKIAIRAVTVASASPALQAAALKSGIGGNVTIVTAVTTAPTSAIPSAVQKIQFPPGAVLVAGPGQTPTLACNSDHSNAVDTGPVPSVVSPAPVAQAPEVDTVKAEGGLVNSNNNSATTTPPPPVVSNASATLPVSVHIPSRETKPSLSPILQATLSQPPKAKNNNNATGSKKGKSQRGKDSKDPKQKGGVGSSSAKSSPAVFCQKFVGAASSSNSSKGNSTLSPASSAIRSLLASKVAQRQQKKLQQQIPKNSKSTLNEKLISQNDLGSPEVVKVNGVGPEGLDKAEESSASSSVLSSDGSDNSVSTKTAVPLTSFHGVLHNGQANVDLKNELCSDLSEIQDETGKNRSQMKGMLIDLLERRVPPREPVNGMVTGREIRISDKGLELVDKIDDSLSGPTIVNHSENTTPSTCATNEVQESQKMTFYSSTSDAQVTLQGQVQASGCVLPGAAVPTGTVLNNSVPVGNLTLSGGGASNSPLTLRNVAGQQVKICGKIIRLIEHSVPLGTSFAATSTNAAIAEVQSSGFSVGDGLISSATAPAANGDVTFIVGGGGGVDSGQAMVVDVDSHSFANSGLTDATSIAVGDEVIIDDVGAMEEVSSLNNNNDTSNTPFGDANCSNGGDLLEKFSEFSDLLVVPPEQLGIKRPSSPLSPSPASNSTGCSDDLPPPAKRPAVDNAGTPSVPGSESQATSLAAVATSCSTVLPSISLATIVTSAGSGTVTTSPMAQTVLSQALNNLTTTSGALSSSTVVVTSNASLPPGSGAQVVQLPLRLSVNPQNPQQLTFTRQLVLPSGQQLLLSTGNSQSGLQGQVILSKPQGSSGDQIPKAIIILQPQQQQNSQNATNSSGSNPSVSVSGTIQALQQQSTQIRTLQTTEISLPTGASQMQTVSALTQPLTTSTVAQPNVIVSTQQLQTSANIPGNVLSQQQTTQQLGGVQQQTFHVTMAQQQPSSQMVVTTHQQLRPTVIPATQVKSQTVVAVHQHPQVIQQQSQAPVRLVASSQQVLKVASAPMAQAQTPLVHQVAASPMQIANVQSSMVSQIQTVGAVAQSHQIQNSHQMHPVSRVVTNNMLTKPLHQNYSQFDGVKSSSYPHLSSDQLDLEFPFLCEWAGCGLRFLKPQQVSMHALKAHCPEALVDAIRCEWGQNGCDPLLRKRFSLMTHLQDRHCSKQALELALYRRKNKIEPPPIPQQPLHHPGYAPNAAFHAIKRHAMSFMNTKELQDDNEGPVTKSIRLTSALILRNLVNYSSRGRRMLQGYESHLSAIAMSNVESSRTIAQLLHDMNEQPKSVR